MPALEQRKDNKNMRQVTNDAAPNRTGTFSLTICILDVERDGGAGHPLLVSTAWEKPTSRDRKQVPRPPGRRKTRKCGSSAAGSVYSALEDWIKLSAGERLERVETHLLLLNWLLIQITPACERGNLTSQKTETSLEEGFQRGLRRAIGKGQNAPSGRPLWRKDGGKSQEPSPRPSPESNGSVRTLLKGWINVSTERHWSREERTVFIIHEPLQTPSVDSEIPRRGYIAKDEPNET
ncbi:hypothetical protein DFH06DRAFT_1137506 [Mycena polygramma]|nr:hypothetical protein DFH06DRAFT_1137506 [Mycena polygramma]